MYLCVIIIQGHPNPSIPPSESNLKCVEDYIRLRASQIEGFHAKSFNISKFNEDYKNHQCFVNFATSLQAKQASELFNNIGIHDCKLRCKYNEPVKENNKINPTRKCENSSVKPKENATCKNIESSRFPTTSDSNSRPVSSKYGNASSPLNSSNIVPYTSHITQNSSLGSLSIQKSAASSSAGMSVLDSEIKKQMNLATSNTLNGCSNSSPVSLKSSPFNSSNIVPNISNIMQNNSLASSATLNSATSTVNNDVQSKCELYLCVIIIKSHPNPKNPPSESNLKCVEDYIRNEASQMEGFHAKSCNMQYNKHKKMNQCFVNFATAVQAKQASELFNNIRRYDCQLTSKYREPVKEDKNEINPVKCDICLDCLVDEKGFACEKGHIACWECLGEYVKHATGPDAVGKTINEKTGNFDCPHFECNLQITLRNLVEKKVPENILNLIEEKKTEFKTKQAVEKELKEQEARLRKEHDDLMKIKDQDEREAARMRLDIVNEVLTLSCPRCKMAFLDYSGCAALTCANGNCKASFCAICLKDCGADAHAHVVICPENASKKLFVSDADFGEYHRKRREKIINEKLNRLSTKTRGLLLEKIGKDLADLGIKVNAIQGASTANQGVNKPSYPRRIENIDNLLKEQVARQKRDYDDLMKITDADEHYKAQINYITKYLS